MFQSEVVVQTVIQWLKDLNNSVDYIKDKVRLEPEVGIILGTGLSQLIDSVDIEISIPYSEIPNFPESTVESHKGNLIFGKFILVLGKNLPVVD